MFLVWEEGDMMELVSKKESDNTSSLLMQCQLCPQGSVVSQQMNYTFV